MKNIERLLFAIVAGLIVSEIVRQYEPWIGYIVYSLIFLAVIINVFIYWRNRIQINITKQNLREFPYGLNFTATNMGDHRNSLDEKVILECLLIPLNKRFPYGRKHKHFFYIEEKDTSLEPHILREFNATAKEDIPQLFFSNFRRYRFSPNRGMYTHIYFTGPIGKNILFYKFYIKRILYRLFYKIDSIEEVTVED